MLSTGVVTRSASGHGVQAATAQQTACKWHVSPAKEVEQNMQQMQVLSAIQNNKDASIKIRNIICPRCALGLSAPESATGRWHADMLRITTALIYLQSIH